MSNQNKKRETWKVEVKLLNKELIKDNEKSATLKSFKPKGTKMAIVPKSQKLEKLKKIKRFNGNKITLLRNVSQVFGNDDRRILTSTAYPWSCTGRLSNGCSAALVGENIILTAAHCIPWDNIKKGKSSLTFTPLFNDGDSLLGDIDNLTTRITGLVYWEESTQVAGYDMVVCKIDKKLGHQLGYFGTRDFKNRWKNKNIFNVVGYPFDIENGQRPVFQNEVAVHDVDRDRYNTKELETEADVASGNSGGPLFRIEKDGPRIIGTCSGIEREWRPIFRRRVNSVFAGGKGLNRLVRYGRDNF